jgi:hypothetical protein
MSLKLTVKPGRFQEELRKRISSFRGTRLSSRLVAPDTVRWWYWLEFGTALRGEPGYASGKTYEIDPVKALVLSWPTGEGARRYAAHVEHPGIRPRAFIRKVLPTVREQAALAVMSAMMRGGFRSNVVKSALTDDAMPVAVNIISASLELEAPGIREDGKLGGQSASEFFAANVKIVS